jgi:hypothetical protein
MPGFPGGLLLLAAAGHAGDLRLNRWWAAFVMALWMLLAGAALALSYSLPWPEGLRPVVLAGSWLLVSVTAAGALTIWLWLRQSALVLALWLAALVSVGWQTHAISAALRPIHGGVALAARAPTLGPKSRLVGCQFNEPSLVFHLNHPWKFTNHHDRLEKELVKKGTVLAVVLRQEWTLSAAFADFWAGRQTQAPSTDESSAVDALVVRHPGYQSERVFLFNAARSSWAEVVVLTKVR